MNRFWSLAWEEEGRKGELHGELEDDGVNGGLRLRQPHAGEAGGQVRGAAGTGQRCRRPTAAGESAR